MEPTGQIVQPEASKAQLQAWQALRAKYNGIPDNFNDFASDIRNKPEAVKQAYDALSSKYNGLPDFNTFSSQITGVNPQPETPETPGNFVTANPPTQGTSIPEGFPTPNNPSELTKTVAANTQSNIAKGKAQSEANEAANTDPALQAELQQGLLDSNPVYQAGKSIVEGTQKVYQGGKSLLAPTSENYEHPVQSITEGSSRMIAGAIQSGFGVATLANPELLAFNTGLEGAGAIAHLNPVTGEVFDAAQTLPSTILNWATSDNALQWAKNLGELGDVAWQYGLFHFGGKVLKEGGTAIDITKAFSGKNFQQEMASVTPKDLEDFKENVTPDQIQEVAQQLNDLRTNPNIEAIKNQVAQNRSDHAISSQDLNNPDLPQSVKDIAANKINKLDAEHDDLQSQLGEAQTQLQQNISAHTDLSNQIDELKQSLPQVADKAEVQDKINELQRQADELAKNITVPRETAPSGEEVASQVVANDVQSNEAGIQSAEADIANNGQGAPQGQTEPQGASIPLMITRDMRQRLYDLGHSKEDVDQMTPQQANDILQQPINTEQNATKTGIEPESNQPEHQNGNGEQPSSETGNSNSDVSSGEVNQEENPQEVKPNGTDDFKTRLNNGEAKKDIIKDYKEQKSAYESELNNENPRLAEKAQKWVNYYNDLIDKTKKATPVKAENIQEVNTPFKVGDTINYTKKDWGMARNIRKVEDEINGIKKNIQQLKEKTVGKTVEETAKIIKTENDKLISAEKELAKLKSQTGQIKAGAKAQVDLFANLLTPEEAKHIQETNGIEPKTIEEHENRTSENNPENNADIQAAQRDASSENGSEGKITGVEGNAKEQEQQLNTKNDEQKNVRSVQEGQNAGQENGSQGKQPERPQNGQGGNEKDVPEKGEIAGGEGTGKGEVPVPPKSADLRGKDLMQDAKARAEAFRNKQNLEGQMGIGTQKSGFSIDPELLNIYKDYVKGAIQEFGDNTTQLIQKLREDFGDLLEKASDKDIKEQILGQQDEKKAENNEPRLVGVSHEALGDIAKRLGFDEIPRGEFVSPKEQAERGKALIANGANPEQVAKEFQDTGKGNADMISVARAHEEELFKTADNARVQFGEKSPEYIKAKKELEDWSKNVIKPMGTQLFHATGAALQGERDVDTGSFHQMERAFTDANGRKPNATEKAKIEELVKQNQEAKTKEENYLAQIAKLIDDAKKEKSTKENKTYGSKNKIVTTDAYQAAKRALAGKAFASAIPPPELFTIAAYHLEAGAHEFADFTKRMIKDVGEKVRPYLKDLYDKGVNDLKSKGIDIEKDLTASHKKNLEELQEQFVDKKDNKFSPTEAKDIWDYAKSEYLDKDNSLNRFENMLNGVSKDVGLSRRQVLEAIKSKKSVRDITDQMYLLQSKRMSAVNAAKKYISKSNEGAVEKFFKAIPRFFFQKAIFAHGTVGMITHAGGNIFKPSMWKPYWRNFFRQYKLAGTMFKGEKGDAMYAEMMNHLTNDPDFAMWKRAGLKIDPEKTNDDYEANKTFFGDFLARNGRGFDSLKFFRLEAAKQIYEGLSNAEKADPDTLKEIATQVNHATGTTNLVPPKISNATIFAPRLELSRWQRTVMQPLKAVNTFSKWNKATAAEKVGAKLTARNTGETIGTYMALLAANQGLLSVLGSKQQVNFTDPSKSDWLKFKGFDRTFDLTGGVVHSIEFLANLWKIWQENKAELHGDTRSKATAKFGFNYVRGKLSPFAGTGVDFALGHDFMGNTMPTSKDKPDYSYNHKLTWWEYVSQHQMPIPIAEAFQSSAEGMKKKGMTNATINGVLDGIIGGGTGAVVRKDYSAEKKKK